ncbi:MAG TPA: SRPBCC family protein, partial [Polyangiaceae bacterium]
ADDRLSAAEWDRLRAGERIEHPKRFSAGDAKYVGGVSYQLVAADPDQVLHALLDPEQLRQMLPHTQHIAVVGRGYPARGLTLEQGNDLVSASYSVSLSHDLERREVRFWLDHSRPSDIDDVRGFFRVEPSDDGRSLITVAAALDLGPGLARLLFENALERLILATPTQMKGVLEATTNGKTRVAQLR